MKEGAVDPLNGWHFKAPGYLNSWQRIIIFLSTPWFPNRSLSPQVSPPNPVYPVFNGAVSMKERRAGRETDHSPLSIAEVKNT
jgi:hypothetical protein